MASDDLIEIEGVVKEVFPGGHFLVETNAGTNVNAHLAGKLRLDTWAGGDAVQFIIEDAAAVRG